MRLEPEGFPNPVHTLTGHACRRSHRANTPLRGISRCRLERLDDDRLDLVVADAPWCAAARLVQQRGDTASHKPRSPLANRRIRQAQLARDLAVGAAITAPQHNLRAVPAHGQSCGVWSSAPTSLDLRLSTSTPPTDCVAGSEQLHHLQAFPTLTES